MKYEVFFTFVGKKMRMMVDANSKEEAENIIKNKPIEIVKCVVVEEDVDKLPESDFNRINNVFNGPGDFGDKFNQIFGGFKR